MDPNLLQWRTVVSIAAIAVYGSSSDGVVLGILENRDPDIFVSELSHDAGFFIERHTSRQAPA
jgi:hypothetical protein